MASKCKSTPSRNPLRSRASISSDPTPFSIQFRNEKAKSDFFENFFEKAKSDSDNDNDDKDGDASFSSADEMFSWYSYLLSHVTKREE